MNWTVVLEWAMRYWVQQACVLFVVQITWLYNKKLKRLVVDQKAFRYGLLALLRDRFYEGYRNQLSKGYYEISEREVMEDLYKQYHALGGNGVMEKLKRELDKLPTMPGIHDFEVKEDK